MNFYMKFPTQILALLNTGSPNTGGGFLDALKGPLLILAVALGLALVIALVILVTHRDGGTKQSRQGHSARLTMAKPKAPGEEGERRKKRRRHKRRRRGHRKRNPTLSETGGLPSKNDDTPGEPKAEEEQ
jgi:hypothetical protein